MKKYIITWEEIQFVMRDTDGVIVRVGENTFAMSNWAFDRGALEVMHNYKIDSNGIAEKL